MIILSGYHIYQIRNIKLWILKEKEVCIIILVEFLLSKRWIPFVNRSFCWNRSLKIGAISMGKNSEIFISIVLEMSKKLSENALWIYFLIMFLRFKITIVFLHGLYIHISSFRSISDAIPPPPLLTSFGIKNEFGNVP